MRLRERRVTRKPVRLTTSRAFHIRAERRLMAPINTAAQCACYVKIGTRRRSNSTLAPHNGPTMKRAHDSRSLSTSPSPRIFFILADGVLINRRRLDSEPCRANNLFGSSGLFTQPFDASSERWRRRHSEFLSIHVPERCSLCLTEREAPISRPLRQ